MDLLTQFQNAATAAGALVVECADVAAAAEHIAAQIDGSILLPPSPSVKRNDFAPQLEGAGVRMVPVTRETAATAVAGVTGACFAIADTGTLVLDSLPEDIRLASTLPPLHFILLDRRKLVADGLAAVAPLRQLHQQNPRNYVAYITGPSRTADIERVLTIGVHGPKRLHLLLLDGWSDDLLEM